jgi:tRNA threonylcarbamoyladenosine biosynthesis protein TsaE
MKMIETYSAEETIVAGSTYASFLKTGDVLALFGELGTGKTRFIQGVCKGLGVREHVASPTFVIVNEYNTGRLKVYHFDFYRIKSLAEAREIGFEEYLDGNGVCLIEWADRVKDLLPPKRYDVQLKLGNDENTRLIEIEEIVGVPA